ncbi:MAG: hypothetical protein HDS75_08385 [Bacteroidales bacterium]|nr:hypothetical protein [Bacteroidales bacterium]
MILWSKLRRSRGFGIHSPFAFDLVLRTLRERDHYYAYSELARLHREAEKAGTEGLPSEKLLRLIIRLIARFKPRRVMISGDRSGLISQAVMLADSHIILTDEAPTFAILTGHGDQPPEIETACTTVRAGGVALLLDRRKAPDEAKAIEAVMQRGMTFFSRHKFLAVGARHLPRQDFEISF